MGLTFRCGGVVFMSSPTRTGEWESHSTQPARRGLHPIPHYVTVVHVRNGLKRTLARKLYPDHGYAHDRTGSVSTVRLAAPVAEKREPK